MNSLTLSARPNRIKRSPSESRARTAPLSGWLTFGTGLWLLDWASINTGPWDIGQFGGTFGSSMTAARAAAPLVVFAITLPALLGAVARRRSWVERGFWIYGLFALLAATGSAVWFSQAYWGFAFLGALGAAELTMRRPDRLASLERLNWISWIVTTTVLTIMIFLARDVLMAPMA